MRPEQIRALAYLERKGTKAPVETVLREVAGAFDLLERRLDTLSALPTSRRPNAKSWSLLEIVDHLIASHRPAVDQLRSALDGADPGPEIPAGLQSAMLSPKGWLEHVSTLRAVHRDFLAELTRGSDDAQASEIPVVMVVKTENPDGSSDAIEWIERLHWKAFAIGAKVHTLEHLAQIERTIALLS
ncbi:MAG: hypothetical protein K8J08_19305 [Thermoanaerobaculia bacterium]|nr:hypothetical protein [Thermoanaerobaculia bacterium]